jgi:hypothetical protein
MVADVAGDLALALNPALLMARALGVAPDPWQRRVERAARAAQHHPPGR